MGVRAHVQLEVQLQRRETELDSSARVAIFIEDLSPSAWPRWGGMWHRNGGGQSWPLVEGTLRLHGAQLQYRPRPRLSFLDFQ